MAQRVGFEAKGDKTCIDAIFCCIFVFLWDMLWVRQLYRYLTFFTKNDIGRRWICCSLVLQKIRQHRTVQCCLRLFSPSNLLYIAIHQMPPDIPIDEGFEL